jgi:hypothetical protein
MIKARTRAHNPDANLACARTASQSWEEQANQILYFDARAGLLQFVQYGVCLGVCARL